MKNGICMKLCGGSLAVSAFIILTGAAAGAATGMTAMMDEGISYESMAAQQSFIVKHDNRADMESMLVEGIVYPDSVIAGDAVLIKLDHRQLQQQGMEACLCEDPTALVAVSQMNTYKTQALETKPAAGSEK